MSAVTIDPGNLGDSAEAIVAAAPATAAEVSITEIDSALTRFAGNAIHQNVAEHTITVRLRLQQDGRFGVATASGAAVADVADLIERAARSLAVAPAADIPPLPPMSAATGPVAYSERTANSSPEERAAAVGVVIDAAAAAGLQAFGAHTATTRREIVVNSAGVRRDATTTGGHTVTVMRGADGSGYANSGAVDIGDIDMAAVAAEAVETCARNQNPQPFDPGEYEVILAPYAVAEMVYHLAHMAFTGTAVEEGRSCLRRGERMVSERISIYDDPTDLAAGAFPFDAEGVAARRVDMIRAGVGGDVVHDSATAMRAGTESTGHAQPMPNAMGPWPTHLAMSAGGDDIDSMIASIPRGLYVTRLWYVRDVHPLRTIITGMTREGTFLIDNGRIAGAVRDLRFTQSIVDALGDVRGVSRARTLVLAEEEVGTLVPALHLGRFTFSS